MSRSGTITRSCLALFDEGFRPFFLLAASFAITAIGVWLWILHYGALPMTAVPATLWHGHEMLFGFVGAAIAGFMLIAVPDRTGAPHFRGLPVIFLTVLWALGRIAFATADFIAMELLVVCELAFVPALALSIATPLLRLRSRYTFLLLILATFWLLDAVFLWGTLTGDIALARRSLLSALDVVLLLITVIGGHLVPAFTSSALRARGIAATLSTWTDIDRIVIGSMVLLAVIDFTAPPHHFAAAAAGLASLAHLARIVGWQTLQTLKEPMVWVLHAAYLWLPLGLGLKAIHMYSGIAIGSHWLHALGAGTAATMILAVMSRASLGQTERPLRASPSVVWAYGLLLAAAGVRTFGPSIAEGRYIGIVTLAGGLWMLSFLLFVAAYAPILSRPRATGKAD